MFKIPSFKNLNFIKNKKSIFEEIAKPKDAQGFFEILTRMPSPDPILRKTGKGYETLRMLKSNYQVGTCIESRKAGVTSKNWKLEKDECKDFEFDFWQEIFKIIDVNALIEDILETPLFGFTPIEITYEKADGYLIPTQLTPKPQEWFYFNSYGEFFFNSKSQGGIKIEKDNPKILLPRHRANFTNPYGECLLSRCFYNVVFITSSMEFWVRFAEKYGTPHAIGKYDRSMSDKEKRDLFTTLKKMVQDCIAVIPTDGSIELLEPSDKSGSSQIYENLISKCENNISKVILGQTLTTDVGKNGSYAASQTHQEVREDLVENDVNLCEKTINGFIKKVHGLNFANTNPPLFKIFDDEAIDQSLVERDNKVKTLGVNFTKKYIKKAYGYEDEDFELATSTEPTTDFADSEDNDFKKLENVVQNFSAEDCDKMLNPVLMPVLEFFKQTKDADEAMEKIAEIYPEMNTAELEKTLTKVIFISELLGRVK